MSENNPQSPEKIQQFEAALQHVDNLVQADNPATSAAKGILYSLVETFGVVLGDPDLPAHVRAGYEGLLETAHEISAKLNPPA